MKEIRLKDAFGQTPESVKQCVLRSLQMEDRREKNMKRAIPRMILVTALIVVLLGTAAVAANKLGVMELLTMNDQPNEAAASGVQTVEAEYIGDAVTVRMNDALFDSKGGTWALSWTMENNNAEDNLYVLLDKVLFGGETSWSRVGRNVSEFFLSKEGTESAILGELPDNGSVDCELSFTVLRALAPVEAIPATETLDEYYEAIAGVLKKGGIPMEGDGYLVPDEYIPETTYTENLLATGKFELADQFTMKFSLQDHLLDETMKVYNGEKHFVFDDYELRIREARLSATSAYIQVEYITPEAPKDGGKGIGYLWDLDFTTLDGSWWHGNAGGSFEDPVQMEDGRYMSVYTFEAIELFHQPDVLKMTLITYDDGLTNKMVHEEDAVELKF